MGLESQREVSKISEKVCALIVAAGSSRRMGFDKLMADLDGIPVVARTVSAFESCPEVDEIVLVMNDANLEWGKKLVADFHWTKVAGVFLGGDRRQDSVQRGLEQMQDCGWVVIHDGARPFVDRYLITGGLIAARESGAALAVVPVKDTIKVVDDHGMVTSTPERAALRAAQTPQVFRYDLIVAAYRSFTERADVTDDAQTLELAGLPVRVYAGSHDNIKITTPEDLEVAGEILRRRMGQTR